MRKNIKEKVKAEKAKGKKQSLTNIEPAKKAKIQKIKIRPLMSSSSESLEFLNPARNL